MRGEMWGWGPMADDGVGGVTYYNAERGPRSEQCPPGLWTLQRGFPRLQVSAQCSCEHSQPAADRIDVLLLSTVCCCKGNHCRNDTFHSLAFSYIYSSRWKVVGTQTVDLNTSILRVTCKLILRSFLLQNQYSCFQVSRKAQLTRTGIILRWLKKGGKGKKRKKENFAKKKNLRAQHVNI